MNTDAKLLNKILTIHIQQYSKRIVYQDWVGFIPGLSGIYPRQARIFPYMYINQCDVTYHINKWKNKNCTIISIDAEETFDKIQYPSMIKSPEIWHRGTYFNIINAIYDKPQQISSSIRKLDSYKSKKKWKQNFFLVWPCHEICTVLVP